MAEYEIACNHCGAVNRRMHNYPSCYGRWLSLRCSACGKLVKYLAGMPPFTYNRSPAHH